MFRQSTVHDEANAIRREAAASLFRVPDRVSTAFVPVRQKQDPEIRRAKAQARTAAWRNECDRKRRPEARDIGMALLMALVTSPDLDHAMTSAQLKFVSVALEDLVSRGFDREQVKIVMRRLRNRMVDPGDRQGEESESCGPAIEPGQSQENRSPF